MKRRKPQADGRAVGYIRVSTEDQKRSGLSLEHQRAALEAAALAQGFDLVGIVEDDITSKVPLSKRPGGRRVVELVTGRKVGAVLAVKQDRLFRDVAEAELTRRDWHRRGVRLLALDMAGVDMETATGGLMYTLRAAVAQWERGVIAERTAAALAQKRARGEKTGGGIPYGYRAEDARLIPDPVEQAVIRRMISLRAAGASLREIARALNVDGLKTRGGRDWKAVQVSRAIRNAGRFKLAQEVAA